MFRRDVASSALSLGFQRFGYSNSAVILSICTCVIECLQNIMNRTVTKQLCISSNLAGVSFREDKPYWFSSFEVKREDYN